MSTRILPCLIVAIWTVSLSASAQEIGPAKGTLLLAGGGNLNDEILNRFIEKAGEGQARIVVIPTAGASSDYDATWTGLRPFRPYQPHSLTLLHTRSREQANDSAFIQPLKEATAVWISGGRQWRLADAYLGTQVHKELLALLARGGIIGGSSAGATIQGSYLVRGDTQTNTIMMGDHLEGFGFLKNVGIDQHLLRRNRQFDLLPVLRKNPHLLGIGIDEGTAILVNGDELEVMGESYVAIYEQSSTGHRQSPFKLLKPGDQYQLRQQHRTLSNIYFGSCLQQDQPMPILNQIAHATPSPDLYLFLGDNIYADTQEVTVMQRKYRQLRSNPSFRTLVHSLPILATWDDHDFGGNDAGRDYAMKAASEKMFLDFWNLSSDAPARTRPGIYRAELYGPPGRQVQIILLDTRYFRSPLQKGPKRIGGVYLPSDDKSKTMLGEAQWSWLESQLRQPANLRLIISSIQLVADDAGQECWANLPLEQARFYELLKSTKVNGVIVLSGDRHWSELSVETERTPYPLYDLTSSSLNQKHPRGTPTKNNHRSMPITYHEPNYGRLSIDWDSISPSVTLAIHDLEGIVRLKKQIPLDHLSVPDEVEASAP